MAGGKGTRMKVSTEKPLFRFNNKYLIDYVLDNLSNSDLIDEIFVAVSPHTPKTKDYLFSLNNSFHIIDTPGSNYLNDLSFLLDYFQKDSLNDILLIINADLPFISSETIDFVLEKYAHSNKDAFSVVVPVEIFEEFGLNYSYEYKGTVPSGLNVLRSENIVQSEELLSISKLELAININTLEDADVATRIIKFLKK